MKAIQQRKGSRARTRGWKAGRGWMHGDHARPRRIHRGADQRLSRARRTPPASRTSSTAAARPGFLRVLRRAGPSPSRDFRGNRQFITQGNLAENPEGLPVPDRLRAAQQRIKIVGRGARRRGRRRAARRARCPATARRAASRRSNSGCSHGTRTVPQHIPQRFDAADVARALERARPAHRPARSEVNRLRGGRLRDAAG
ncbi:MAG: hypothetical protein MZW92_43105 [Comamonadaceae bacterium]|nr:hypothetical protein [Comamonadaceae bacterium]